MSDAVWFDEDVHMASLLVDAARKIGEAIELSDCGPGPYARTLDLSELHENVLHLAARITSLQVVADLQRTPREVG